MTQIYYDPDTFEWLPALQDYVVEPYNRNSFLVRKHGDEGVNIVDLEDYAGKGSCTCADFSYRHDPANLRPPSEDSCKHLRLVKFLIRRQTKKYEPS
jgi:hypothetical protein